MRLVCPTCSTQYEVENAKIPLSGRKVKCASCHEEWLARPEVSDDSNIHVFPVGGQRKPSIKSQVASASNRSGPGGNVALAALHDRPSSMFVTRPAVATGQQPQMRARELVEIYVPGAADEAKVSGLSRLSPFREQISDAKAQQAAANAEDAANASDLNGDENTAPDRRDYSSTALRRLRSLLEIAVERFNNAGDILDTYLKRVFQRPRFSLTDNLTPGDREVLEWRQKMRRKSRNRMTPVKAMGWFVLCAYVAGATYLIVFRSDAVTTYVPSAAGFYDLVGVGADIPVMLTDLSHRYAMSHKGPVLEITGQLKHNGDVPVPTPFVEAKAFSEDNKLLTSWVFQVKSSAQLLPGMELPFFTRVLAPEDVMRVEVSVLSGRELEEFQAARSDPLPELSGDAPSGFVLQRTMNGWDDVPETLPSN